MLRTDTITRKQSAKQLSGFEGQKGTGTVLNTVVILKDISHPTFVIVVIVQSCWAFELVKSQFHFDSSTNSQ